MALAIVTSLDTAILAIHNQLIIAVNVATASSVITDASCRFVKAK